ncbi:MAG: SLC13 family permease, partial [Candidatus Krumholzibacteriia bacterium]
LALFVVLLVASPLTDHARATRMGAVAVLMASWWISEAVPLAATALLPLVLYPLLGIQSGKETAPVYVNSTIFLFVGGFMIARCMEAWALHRRIALRIVRLVGSGPTRVVLGLMLASAFLSMFISNTAAAVIMLPIGLAIVLQLEDRAGRDATAGFAAALMLGIAYACSVGGIATLVGTPPNLAFQRILAITFPEAPPVSFGQWLLMGLPLSASFLVAIWLLLTRVFFHLPKHVELDRGTLDVEYSRLGRMRYEEKVVFAAFITTALLWTFRNDLRLGFVTLPGWSNLLPSSKLVDDATVAVCMALLLFLVPARSPEARGGAVMPANIFSRLPWDIVLLFGGGFALAAGFQNSGLSELAGRLFSGLVGVPAILVVVAVCTMLTFLTEFTSNTATTQLLLPILASVAVAMQINPLLLMVPAALSASCAFMMPVATPPNAIVFGSGRLRIADMVRAGFWINLLGIVLITLVFYVLGTSVFGIDTTSSPPWARAGQ